MRNRDSKLLLAVVRELQKLRHAFNDQCKVDDENHKAAHKIQKSARRWQIVAVILAAYVVLPGIPIGSWHTPGSSLGNDFSSISKNLTDSISKYPESLTHFAYGVGVVAGLLGILSSRDHLEQPTQFHLKDEAIRLAGVYEAMSTTVGDGNNVTAASLNKIDFAVR